MADNSFRTFRRDANGADAADQHAAGDPLAELARLIGQSGQHGGRDFGRAETAFEDRAPAAPEWAAEDDESATENLDAGQTYAPSWSSRDPDAAEETFAEPARGSVSRDGRYADEARSSRAEMMPYLAPGDGGYPVEQQDFSANGDHAHRKDDREAASPRRSGTILVMAVAGLAVFGSAAALGYHAMFGGSMIPSLPPIIKPGNTPIKIVPDHEAQGAAPNQTGDGGKAMGDRLVAHEERPVTVQSADPAPHVITTVPVITNAPAVNLSSVQQPPALPASSPATVPPRVPEANDRTSNTGALDGSAQEVAGLNQLISPDTPRESKPVHTVTIRPDQPPTAAKPGTAAHHAAVRQPANQAPRTVSGAPLSIVPGQNDSAPAEAQHTRAATAQPAVPLSLTSSAPADRVERTEHTASIGGYAVQVSSQRSEAEATAAFRSLQARFPEQLGNRQAMVRRADLGAKGVYYRALVGPFSTSQEAAGLCGKLKSAGGSCLVQKD